MLGEGGITDKQHATTTTTTLGEGLGREVGEGEVGVGWGLVAVSDKRVTTGGRTSGRESGSSAMGNLKVRAYFVRPMR